MVKGIIQNKIIFMKARKVPQLILVILLLCFIQVKAQVNTASADVDWTAQQVTLKNTSEADFIIRIGDVDNPGFGWPEGFQIKKP